MLHESTAWFLALGVAMIAAGIWTTAAVGVAAIAGAFGLVLIGYVAADAYSGQVTAVRIASHCRCWWAWCSQCWSPGTGPARRSPRHRRRRCP
ncbi:hypothetical protein H7I76_19560 [Mycolicibacterium vaccae]|nr:hypothetical protein [Mycolicibacterium vaccae]